MTARTASVIEPCTSAVPRLGSPTAPWQAVSSRWMQAVRNLVSLGASLEFSLSAASRNPARLLRRDDLGELQVGGHADIVVLDDRLEVRRTLVGGAEVSAA